MKKSLIVLLSLLISVFSYTQEKVNYFNLASLHWNLYEQGKMEESLHILKIIDTNFTIFPPNLPIFLKTSLLNTDKEMVKKLLLELLTRTDFDTSKFAKDSIFRKIYSMPAWKNMKRKFDSLRNIYYRNLDIELISELNAMLRLDQYGRLHYPDTLLSIYPLTEEIDKYNFEKLKRLIDNKGFPQYSKVGKRGFKAIYIVLMHNSTYQGNLSYIDSLMRQQMYIGNWESWRYANIIDRYYFIMKGYQIYGTFINRNDAGEKVCGKIKEIKNLDKRRKEIGLSSFIKYANSMKIKGIPEEYFK